MDLVMRCVYLKQLILVLFVIFTLSASVRRNLGLSIAQGHSPAAPWHLGRVHR